MSSLIAPALSALLMAMSGMDPTPVATRTAQQKPVWLSRPFPEPAEVRKACPKALPGTPILEAHLLGDGTVGEVKITRSSGCKGADKLLEQSIRKWKFKPILEGDKPVTLWLTMTVSDLGGR